jgi:hypothetical protein
LIPIGIDPAKPFEDKSKISRELNNAKSFGWCQHFSHM